MEFYGTLSVPPRDPFILFVWEVLTLHSTPKKAELALGSLRKSRALTPDSMWKVPQAKLEAAVALAGPYQQQRLSALKAGVAMFRRSRTLPARLRGSLRSALRAVRPLPHLGEAGAHRMLLFAGDHCILPVDAAVQRVALRLGYGVGSDQVRMSIRSVRRALAQDLPPMLEDYRRACLYLSHHGMATCTEVDPHCAICPLLVNCPEGSRRIS
jgi:endonuclease-3